MKVATLKVGHFEVNYGDQHFRRSDNGKTLYNPFVGNFVIDAFTTEIGAEAYLRKNGFMAMVGMTGGEVKGQVTTPRTARPHVPRQARLRQAAHAATSASASPARCTRRIVGEQHAHSGDRAGSATTTCSRTPSRPRPRNAWSGAIQSGMKNMVTAFVVNPFVKVGGARVLRNVETDGRGANEIQRRTLRQLAGEGLYRFAGTSSTSAAATTR